ncbi:drug resistance transporter, EmrB/QacA subfamily [Actinacidiphila yanglinensis]|uniref:Drug resistance transporter, EmrB/QacA subfamily n=1 Tax=Actinacidiphila yanglinensis TaxID=310779 RepID=A0A1H6CR06_9ACTN|nr:MFS transporter [Actinacidiphila yanglinensis]SEG74866.1 drug resistance transporter, EmrB/QacA subfamily [Actinacidiphila yanglinensis]
MEEAPTRAPAGGKRERDRRWPALAVCLTASFMTLLDISIVNVALPSIRTGIGASQSGLQWVLSGYALTFGLVLVPAGRTGDVHSRRAVFQLGLAMFTVTSALAGAAQNEGWLITARLLQGAAGGILVPQVSGFIQQMFQGAERGRAFGLMGATIGVSTAVGPLLGGLLIQAFGTQEGWRWVFFVNLPIGLAALPVAHRLLPGPPRRDGPDPRGRPHGDLDPVGVLLLGIGTVVLLLPFVEEDQWSTPLKWLLVPASLLILALFVEWERRYAARGREPLVALGLFRQRSYGLGVLLSLLYFAGFTAIFFILTLYLQNGLHYTALEAGLSIMPFALGSGAAAAVGGRIVTRIGRPLVAFGLVMVVVGLLGTALAVHLDAGRSIGWVTAGPLLFAGLGSGLVIAPNQTLTLSEVPVARAGSAGGVLQTAQRIGSAAGIAAVGSVFFSRVDAHHADWSGGFQLGVLTSTGLAALALVVALVDILGSTGSTAPDRR